MDLRSIYPKEELSSDAPPRLSFQMSLGNARARDAELSRLAGSPDRAEQHQACGILGAEAAAAPPKEPIPACWDRPDASYWLLHTEVDSKAFCYSSEGLYMAATLCAAEL